MRVSAFNLWSVFVNFVPVDLDFVHVKPHEILACRCRALLALAQNQQTVFWSLKKTDFLGSRFRAVGLLKTWRKIAAQSDFKFACFRSAELYELRAKNLEF